MTLTTHPDDSRREGQTLADTNTNLPAGQTPAVHSPALAPDAPRRPGRPAGSVKQGATGLRGQCWWLMRELNTFTINRLLETYATGEECNPHINLRGYLFRLEAYGVVERLQRRQPGDALSSHGFVVWRLKRNLGILAPVWRREQKVLWDPNAGQVVEPIAAQAQAEAQQQEASQVNSEPNSND